MLNSDIVEYSNRNRMEETTAKVFARLHRMKTMICKNMKKRSHICGVTSNYDSYLSSSEHDEATQTTIISSDSSTSDDTISSINSDSTDSGVSTLSDFSRNSSRSSSTLSLHRPTSASFSSRVRCDPSIINYVSHDLISNDQSTLCLSSTSPLLDLPLAESSRHVELDNEQTLMPEDDDEPLGPLTSTLIDRWYSVTKHYTAVFREDLPVRKNELVQIIRSTHPHWLWVRNEDNAEGFIPTDCLLVE